MVDGELNAKIALTGTLQYRNAEGEVIKEVSFSGNVPIDLKEETEDGADDSE